MENDIVSLREINPDRPADWRWQRAILSEGKNFKSKSFDDKDVTQIVKYLRSKKQGLTSEELCRKFPVLYEVDRIYTAASTLRWTLEAFIMANMKPQEISERFGWGSTGVKIINLYERVRFDVRARLKFDSFILASVLGQVLNGTVIPSDEKIWKMLAWVGGRRQMGSALLDGYLNIEHMPKEVRKWYDTFIDHQFTRKTIRALFKFDPVSSPQVLEIVRMHNENRKLDMELAINGKGNEDDNSEYAGFVKKHLAVFVANVNKVADSSIEPRAFGGAQDPGVEQALSNQVVEYQQKMLSAKTDNANKSKKEEE